MGSQDETVPKSTHKMHVQGLTMPSAVRKVALKASVRKECFQDVSRYPAAPLRKEEILNAVPQVHCVFQVMGSYVN